MKFWDSSAIIPLLVGEKATTGLRAIVSDDRRVAVWWGTEVECVSTLSRLERERVGPQVIRTALGRLSRLREDWDEVPPSAILRETAVRLLRVHTLRAGDALQLAAAWVLADLDPASVELVSLDGRLREAARREGFAIIPEELS